jgi:hypothetical protein
MSWPRLLLLCLFLVVDLAVYAGLAYLSKHATNDEQAIEFLIGGVPVWAGGGVLIGGVCAWLKVGRRRSGLALIVTGGLAFALAFALIAVYPAAGWNDSLPQFVAATALFGGIWLTCSGLFLGGYVRD